MKKQLASLASRVGLVLMKVVGPYRLWRMVHELNAREPEFVCELFEYIFKAQLPTRFLRKPFIDYWLSDDLAVRKLRQDMSRQSAAVGYAVRLYHELSRLESRWGCPGGRVLELGPGTHLGSLFCFAAEERDRVVGVDIAPITGQDNTFYRILMDYLAVSSGLGWWRHYAYSNSYREIQHPMLWGRHDAEEIYKRIDYRAPVSASRLPFDDRSFNLLYSVTAFEHFPEPDSVVSEISRVLSPGGLTVHEIDMRYHLDMRYHRPREALNFLEWDDNRYRGVSEKYGEGRNLAGLLAGKWGNEVYCNRLRFSDCIDLFRNKGFEILNAEPLEVLDPKEIDRARFVEPFRSKSLDDLSILVGRIVARKLV